MQPGAPIVTDKTTINAGIKEDYGAFVPSSSEVEGFKIVKSTDKLNSKDVVYLGKTQVFYKTNMNL